ncbi:MAG: cyclohexanone monooxygenase [Candidatus Azotimanducaceae bacterium]|jgi:cyclohexanone monooxygenase
MSESKQVDVVVVGAGFGGMYMLHRLKSAGLNVQVIERGDGVGGTWYWNRYPGARVDIQSMEYSYQFSEELQQEWEWSERYSPQPEILAYANHVADRFDLRSSILFETEVVATRLDEKSSRWHVETDNGQSFDAQFCIMATGCLSSTNLPAFEGLDSFAGDWYHTGLWPHEGVDFTGKRVGLVGTGSSAIQTIPQVAKEAGQLTVFQRTANYSIPAHNQDLDPEFVDEIKSQYKDFRAANKLEAGGFGSRTERNDGSVFEASEAERQALFEKKWDIGGFGFLAAFGDLLMTGEANDYAAEFVRNKIRATVSDSETAELLCPDQVIGCKRICVDINYFETYNRDNVKLVNIKDAPIERITAKGLVTGGKEYDFDCLVFATGFDAMTGTLNKMEIQGRDGQLLRDKWIAGPRNYLGLCTAGFPNLFTISGPGSPSVLTNMITSIEQHVEWIANCILDMKSRGVASIEAELAAEDAWVDHVNELAGETLYPSCNSWYLGANIPGKTRVFMPYVGGLPVYAEKCEEVRNNDYEGFKLAS